MPNTGHTTDTSFSIFADFSTDKQALNSFNDLAEVVGGTDLINFLPEEIQGSSGLQVEKFEIAGQMGEQSEISVEIEVGMDKAWTVIEEVFVIEEIRSRFYVKNPFTSASREITFSLAGKLEIGGGTLAVTAHFAENQQQLFAKLEEGDQVDLLQVFEQVGIPLGEVGLDNFESSILDIEIDAIAKSYKFDIKLDTAWSVFGSLQIGDLLFKAKADFDSQKKEYAYQVNASGEIILGGATINIAAVYEDIGGWNFTGFTQENEPPIPIGRLIGDLSEGFGGVELPAVLDDVEITRLEISFRTLSQDFRLICQTSIQIGTGSAELSLIIDIRQTTSGYTKLFAGELTIEGKTFAVSFTSDPSTTSLIALFQDRGGAEFNLIDFLNAITNDSLGLSNKYNLAQLSVYLLRLSYQKNKSTGNTRYEFLGDFAWQADLGLGGGSSLEIDASLKLIKESGQTLKGEICGAINTPIEFLEFLSIAACYEFGQSRNSLTLQLQIATIIFEAEYPSNDAGDFTLIFGLKLDSDNGNKFTLGDIISFFASLVDPSIEEFEFADPWNFLVEYNLFDLLEHVKLTLTIDKATKKKTFGFTFDKLDSFVPDSLKPLLSVNSLTFDFTGKEEGNKSSKKFKLSLDAKFLGTNQTLEWDPINEDPPEIPGTGSSVFELRYLGFGQRIAFTGVGQVESIKEVMGLLRGVIEHADVQVEANRALKNRNPMELFGDGGPIAFSPESEWLIGMDLTLLKFLSLKVIFNDPLIYGLRIELAGEAAQNFAGLQFEILYRRVTDTIGVYHLELTLPDFVRYLQFGAVSITLPVLVLDIFTNGDFKVDLGFPWNFNFARSFSLEIFPFVGSGGIYFNKLSAATATSTPTVLGGDAQGIFTPVYEFGLGLSIGLGKTFNAGPLKAEISLTVQGILEGVISWYNPRLEGERELYYLVRGGIAIVGRLYGAVDFGIIRVDIEVLAIAKVQFVVEVYKKIYISLSAEVSVRASIKIVFVRIRFSFSLRVEQNFTIGSDKLAPWERAINTRQVASRAVPRSLSRSIAGFSWGVELWAAESDQKVLDIFFQPAFSWTPSGVKGEALFFIENSINASSSDRKDFDELVKILLRWVWKAHDMDEARDSEDLGAELEALYEVFANDNSPLFTYAQLQRFLGHHFIFRLSECESDIEGSLFPVFPHLSMKLGDDGILQSFEELGWQLDEVELQSLKTYFNQLKVQFAQAQNGSQSRNVSTRGIGSKTAITEFVFADYFRLLIRSALQVASDFVKENENAAKNMLALVEALGTNQKFEEVASMASRFFLYGLHLPRLSDELPAQALYQATGQQFELAAARGTLGAESGYKVQIAVTPLAEAETPILHFELPSDAGLTYFLQQTEDKTYAKYPLVETLNILTSQQLDNLSLPSAKLEAIPFYQHEILNFALRKWIIWNHTAAEIPTPATSEYILPFPSSLTNYLLDKSTNPTISLAKDKLSDNSDTLDFDLNRIEAHLFYWATQVEVQIRLIPQTEEEGFLADTYVISGMSEADHNLLEDVWIHLAKAGVANVGLSLLSLEKGENTTQLVDLPLSNSEIIIVKNNLSTESNSSSSQSSTRSLTSASSTVLHAKAEQVQDFIQLIWEANTVNTGGYFLHIPNDRQLNDKLFAGAAEATLSLLIRFEDTNAPVFDFHNCAIYTEDIEISDYLITAQSTETVPMLGIPAGHLGLHLARPEATEDYPIVKLKKKTGLKTAPDDDLAAFMQLKKEDEVALTHISNDGKWVCAIYQTNIRGWIKIDNKVLDIPNLDRNEVDNLYQLLGYEIQPTSSPESHAPQGLPIGPTGEDIWVYERLISTSKLFDEGAISNGAELPSAQQNPYLGIADQAELKVKSWWNDLYGNQLLEKASESTFKIRYTDPIIGINEWPSVAENYEFVADTEQQAKLKIELAFDTTPYEAETNTSEENRLNKIKAALITYKQIYYQLLQADTILQLDTSVLNGARSFPVNKSRVLSDFVEAIYRYLSQVLSGVSIPPPPPPIYAETFFIIFDDGTQLLYKEAFIFSIEVTIDIKRNTDLIHADLKNEEGVVLPEYKNVANSKTYLSPKLNQATTEQTQSLKDFARNFEAAFRHLKLAVSALPSNEQTNAEKQARRPLWAVHLSDKGVHYNIQEALPAFFAIPPLANSLKSDKVLIDDYENWKNEQLADENLDQRTLTYNLSQEEKQFDALDINVLARDFLVAVEEFLEADSLIPAYQLAPDTLTTIVEQKAVLATAISDHVVPILAKDIGKDDQQSEAKSTIKQQLLIHLVEGYDIETIVQYGVEVSVGSHLLGKLKWEAGKEPRIAGKAVIVAAYQGTGDNRKEVDIQSLDFSLAAGKISLKSKGGKTYFTYLFDTRSPEKFRNIYLELAFKSTEIEYNIEEIDGINQYEASSWLSFVLPDSANPANDMGTNAVPIPLRNYPMPPSLIFHQAEADPDSELELSDVRQWKYSCVYEHPDVAQDTIDCVIKLNVPPPSNIQTRSLGIPERNLFEALVNFSEIYPALSRDLALIQKQTPTNNETLQAQIAVVAFEHLVSEVSSAWSNWNLEVAKPSISRGNLHYELREEINSDTAIKRAFIETLKTISPQAGAEVPAPVLALPTYFEGEVVDNDNDNIKEYTFEPNPMDIAFFGDSSIPDRKFSIENLDVIHQQNAWATIWLSRNKELIPEKDTNPIFVFQTPEVKFNSKITPSLVNDERWDINRLAANDNSTDRSLLGHLRRMFHTILPQSSTNEYEIRMSCRYAFVMTAGSGLSQDLLSMLPMLMGLRLSKIDEQYIQSLTNKIEDWRLRTKPAENKAAYIFSINIFSKLDPNNRENLPLLKIEHLQLNLEDIE